MLSYNDILKIKNIMMEAEDIVCSIKKSGIEVSYKKDNSPVTNADIKVSKHIVAKLKHFIDVPVISEEEDFPPFDGKSFWLVDPIDGTKSYIKGEPLYTINLGLIIDGVPIYGFIQNPSTHYLYYTPKPDQMLIEHDGETVEYGNNSSGMKAVVSTNINEPMNQLMKDHAIESYEVIPGTIKFCLLASGEADLWPRPGVTMEWDTAAGHALMKAVGGEVLDFNGNVLQYAKRDFANNGFIAYSKRALDNRRASGKCFDYSKSKNLEIKNRVVS